MCWAGLGWAGLGWAGLDWIGLDWNIDWIESYLIEALPIVVPYRAIPK